MADYDVPSRLLLGPGPSPVSDRVRLAMAKPLLGHMDPAFLAIVDRVQDKLRTVFGTNNALTFPVSGTGSAGMQMSLSNFIEPGDSVLVIEQGVFGQRMADAARRLFANVYTIVVPFGSICTLDNVVAMLDAHPDITMVSVVKAETSTGVLQPLDGWAEAIHSRGALLLVDAVTALGGIPVDVDAMQFDIVFSGTQKCLACPPGLAPITVGDRALKELDARKTPVVSWYLDLKAISQYLGKSRAYHHTAPVSMIYALDEALTAIMEEGLPAVIARHQRVAESLWAGLEAMDLYLMVKREYRLPTVATVAIPQGVNDSKVRRRLLEEYGIEIAGGLGDWSGKTWRIGVMGRGAEPGSMLTLIAALRECLEAEGVATPSGIAAFEDIYWKRGWN